jgi:hypothetical protein
VLVLDRRLDPMAAAMVGGLALVAVEVGTAWGRSRWVPSVGGGTQVARVGVLGGSLVGALLVSLVVDPQASPRQGSLAIGTLAVGVLLMAVAVAVGRPWSTVPRSSAAAPPPAEAAGPLDAAPRVDRSSSADLGPREGFPGSSG